MNRPRLSAAWAVPVAMVVALVPTLAAPGWAAEGDPAPTLGTPFNYINDAYSKAVQDIWNDKSNDVQGTGEVFNFGGISHFHAGKHWDQAWLRDTSFSADLGLAIPYPDIARKTISKMVQQDPNNSNAKVWYQDQSGHFPKWPDLTDSIVGAVGAWSIYLTEGNTADFNGTQSFLDWSYELTQNTLKRAEREVQDSTGLFKGCSVFMESFSAYPSKYWEDERAGYDSAGKKTMALSTNLLYYRGYQIAAKMATKLGKATDAQTYTNKAANLKAAINGNLWDQDKGYYAYYVEVKNTVTRGITSVGAKSDRIEGLGEALAILWGVADDNKAAKVLQNVPRMTGFPSAGMPTLWPKYPEWEGNESGTDTSQYYHNGMIWPFVQGYWAWAAASQGDVDTFHSELRKLLSLQHQTDTFQEFYKDDGNPRLPDGSLRGSERQLWSASGFLAMIYHGLFGMNLTENGLEFRPTVPANFNVSAARLDSMKIKYRNATLDISILGAGNAIKEFKLDGANHAPIIPTDLTGQHTVQIEMAGSRIGPVTGLAGKCIDVRGANPAQGTPIQLQQCNGTPAQRVTVTWDQSLRVLGKCVDVTGGGMSDGTNIQLYPCNNTGAQRWEPTSSGGIRNPQSGLCLAVPGTTSDDGTQLQIKPCVNGSDRQKWTLPVPRGPINLTNTAGPCIDAAGSKNNNGTAVQLFTCNGTDAQVVYQDGSSLRLLGKCMDVAGGKTDNETKVQLYDCNGTGAQVWEVQSNGALRNPQSDRCLDDPDASPTPGTQLQIYDCNGTDAQKWYRSLL
ncbi:ricin-type beta-trefoil lectin domain protein [Streptomyces sp. SLBN-118]|uniref:ricin-type beta-trefoil lectin domain protein n=1 Tax=Streptomyces sp. SLBN-118 TaxID=2768454 RepID=UPI00135AAEC5|nr:ricin-type beta-trefoil lectin domain protein [Streptomyces sp. SLBN-118]